MAARVGSLWCWRDCVIATPRPVQQYFLRVPPRFRTCASAVAWTFGLSPETYHPADES
ncbi:MAG TPA: hypothetical protein VGO93_11295 [Candidatus Xenobia bacterium]